MQRPFHYAIVDEADSILIDEARVPLVIAGSTEADRRLDPARAARAGRAAGAGSTTSRPTSTAATSTSPRRGSTAPRRSWRCGNLHDAENLSLLTELNMRPARQGAA